MRIKALLLSLALAVPVAGAGHALADVAPDTQARQLAALCAKLACRKPGRALELRQNDGSLFKVTLAGAPYLDDKGEVVLFPDETIALTMTKQDDGITAPVLLQATGPDGSLDVGSASQSTLSFTLRQDDGNASMTLTATNRVPVALRYDVVMSVPSSGGGIRALRTNVCTLLPPQGQSKSFSGIENWPNPIVMLVISNIRVATPDEIGRC